jgi:hypothetical protein
MMTKRLIAVIDVPDGGTPSCLDAVHWLESMIDRSTEREGYEVTTYSTVEDLIADEREKVGAFTSPADPLPMTAPPACGHSACRQHWIDSGQSLCVEAGAA